MKKEMIKAIRMVKGYTTDLRVNIRAACRKESLYDWIYENRIGIFGLDMTIVPEVMTPEWKAFDHRIWEAVEAVITGKGE